MKRVHVADVIGTEPTSGGNDPGTTAGQKSLETCRRPQRCSAAERLPTTNNSGQTFWRTKLPRTRMLHHGHSRRPTCGQNGRQPTNSGRAVVKTIRRAPAEDNAVSRPLTTRVRKSQGRL